MAEEEAIEVDEGATNALFQAVGGMQDNLRSAGVANTPKEPPFQSITHEIDPKTGKTYTTVKGVTEETLKAFEENQRVAAQAKDIYGQIIQQAMAKKATLEAHPLVSAIGRITSQAATNYQLQGNGRPLVNAAGAFGQEYFRDTPESLLVRAAQAREKQFAITNQVQNQAEDIRRFDVQQSRIDAQIAQQAKASELAERKEVRLTKASYESEVMSGARAGNVPDDQTIMKSALAHDFTPEEGAVLVERAQEVAANSKRDKQLIQDIADRKQAAQFAFQTAQFNAATSRMFSLEGMREAAAAQRAKEADEAKAVKAGKIGDVKLGKIGELDAQITQLEQLEGVIQKYPQYQLSFKNPMVAVPGYDKAVGLMAASGLRKDAAQELRFRTDLRNSIQAINKTHGAGARGYNPTEFKLVFEPLTAAPTRTQAQNLAAIQSAKSLLLNKLQAEAQILEGSEKDISKIKAFKRLGLPAAGTAEGAVKKFNPATGKVE